MEKTRIWMRSLLQNKTKSTAGDHDRDNPTGRVQRQGVGEDKEYVAHKMASTGTYPSTLKPHSYAFGLVAGICYYSFHNTSELSRVCESALTALI